MFRNTAWNVAGTGIPILAALVAVPLLISQLGAARFGVLALGWMITGYFSLFDFGVSRAATRSLAALKQAQSDAEYAATFWNSLYLHGILAAAAGLFFAALVPTLVTTGLPLAATLQDETELSFYWLAFSVPALVMASALRAPLEANHRFDLVNAVKMPASVLNYLAPLAVLQFTQRLDLVIAVISLSRWVAFVALALLARWAVPPPHGKRHLKKEIAAKLLLDGGWLSISSVAVPLIMMLDRGLIARLVSLEAVTYYTIPYEVITKMWVLSASVLGAAYPLMSAATSPALAGICRQSSRWLLTAATPALLAALILGHDFLNIWVGPGIASQSTLVLQWLAVGVWLSVIGQVPLTALQATGHARTVALVQFAELLLYVGLAWYLVQRFGPVGAAAAWTVRALAEWTVLHRILARMTPGLNSPDKNKATHVVLLVLVISAAILAPSHLSFHAKCALAALLIGALSFWQWKRCLAPQERIAVRLAVLRMFGRTSS